MHPSSSIIRAHVFISGMVQGVGYRFAALNKAQPMGVRGWVKNLPDGRVEAVFEGPELVVEEMIRWCRQGPRSSIVHDMTVQYEEPTGIEGFDIHRA